MPRYPVLGVSYQGGFRVCEVPGQMDKVLHVVHSILAYACLKITQFSE